MSVNSNNVYQHHLHANSSFPCDSGLANPTVFFFRLIWNRTFGDKWHWFLNMPFLSPNQQQAFFLHKWLTFSCYSVPYCTQSSQTSHVHITKLITIQFLVMPASSVMQQWDQNTDCRPYSTLYSHYSHLLALASSPGRLRTTAQQLLRMPNDDHGITTSKNSLGFHLSIRQT